MSFADHLGQFGDSPALDLPRVGAVTYRKLSEDVDAYTKNFGSERRLILLEFATSYEAIVACLAALKTRNPIILAEPNKRTANERTADEFGGKRSTEPLSHFCHGSGISGKNAHNLWHLCYGCGWDVDGCRFRRPGFQPVDRQEGFKLLSRRVVHELLKHPIEVGERVSPVAADLFDEGVDDRTAPAGVLTADEHPVLVTEFGGPYRILC